MDELRESMENFSPLEHHNSDSKAQPSRSQPSDRMDEGTTTNKELQITLMPQSDGKCAHNVAPTMVEYPAPPTQLELVGHSIAYGSHSYPDPYYGEAVPAYGLQPSVHSHYRGVHSSRMALPLVVAEEPVYVNAKQYHGILRRRQSRAKAELEKKLIKVRKPYLHESRHLHAVRRARGSGGRFLNTKKPDSTASSNTRPDNGTNFGATLSGHSTHTSSCGPVLSHFPRNADSSAAHPEVTDQPGLHKMNLQQAFSCANTKQFSSHHQGFQLSPYR